MNEETHIRIKKTTRDRLEPYSQSEGSFDKAILMLLDIIECVKK